MGLFSFPFFRQGKVGVGKEESGHTSITFKLIDVDSEHFLVDVSIELEPHHGGNQIQNLLYSILTGKINKSQAAEIRRVCEERQIDPEQIAIYKVLKGGSVTDRPAPPVNDPKDPNSEIPVVRPSQARNHLVNYYQK